MADDPAVQCEYPTHIGIDTHAKHSNGLARFLTPPRQHTQTMYT